ncbi:MAG TPA: efflux RND transporter permease subunit, partial [Caulobacteraceae bacterium]|nr:efflux RND transporter permease subunit [Caulobacteraceae bacterium]
MTPTRQLRISAWAIQNPTPVAVMFIALVLAGIISYLTLPVKNFPDIQFPLVIVTVTQSGAAPQELKTQVTRQIEDAVSGITDIDAMSSVVTQGSSVTRIQFNIGTNLQKATDDVRAKVDAARALLPREIDPPNVQQVTFDDQPIITYAVTPAPGSNMTATELSWLVDNDLSRTLQGVPGVGQVQRQGGVVREINIIVDPARMAAQGVTAPQINQALTTVSEDAAGGRVQVGGREQTLRVLGAATTVDQIRNLALPGSGGRFIKLSDVADVGDGTAEVRAEAKYDGRPVVAFNITKTTEASDITTENGVDAALDEMVHGAKSSLFNPRGTPPSHPEIRVQKIFSQVDDTRGGFNATKETMFEGMVLAAFVVWLFLRDWRATAVTAIAMPVSLIPTFIFMAMVGFSLDLVSLLALTLVIGILVDDAIVEIENIEKRVHVGMRPYAAAMEGADQIGLAVVATTSAIIVVFAPVSFMPGIPGQFFKEFGLTISVAVLFSLVTARLLTPLLAAYFLKPKPPRPRAPLPGVYVRTLHWALDHRILASLVGFAIFVLSVVLAVAVVPKGLQPENNPNFYEADVDAPPGSTLADTRLAVAQLADLLKRQPETEHVYTSVGSADAGQFGAPSATGVTTGAAIAILKPHGRPKVAQIRDRLRPYFHQIPDVRVTMQGQNFGGSTVQVTLSSESGQDLDAAALELQREMAGLRTLADPRPATAPPAPELIIRPRPDDAARLGVDADTIASVARIATVGDIDANVAKLDVGDRRIPIRVRLPESSRTDLPTLRDLRVPTASGGLTTLGSVADVYFQAGPAEITRYDRRDDVIVLADLVNGAKLSSAYEEVERLPIMQHLPPGVVEERNIGNQQAQSQLFAGFGIALFAGIGLVYGVMVLLFGSFFKPITILAALPLSIAGAMIALLLAHSELSIPSMIGLFMLMGIAAKNSILLVEYAIERERGGATQREALLEACRERARPIVMTTLAMMAGMLPTALGLGVGSEFRQPMAVAVIGGLITSTLLSLVLVPVVYEFIDDFEAWLRPKLIPLITPKDAVGPSTAQAPPRA